MSNKSIKPQMKGETVLFQGLGKAELLFTSRSEGHWLLRFVLISLNFLSSMWYNMTDIFNPSCTRGGWDDPPTVFLTWLCLEWTKTSQIFANPSSINKK